MENSATFFFHGLLNDFLLRKQKNTWLPYEFKGTPALKDAVEALGVPHPEVGEIVVNGANQTFKASLPAFARVEVHPVLPENQNHRLPSLQVPTLRPVQFVLDVHLGKLARYLRLLGFDTVYETNYDDATIAQIAAQENRVVLTRDIGLLKQRQINWGRWLRSQEWEEQLQEVLLRFGLFSEIIPFTRCMACNGFIKEREKEEVLRLLPPKTKLHFQQFYQCTSCERVYWKGSHYEKMEEFLQKLTSGTAASGTSISDE